jgi:hypothetical protein
LRVWLSILLHIVWDKLPLSRSYTFPCSLTPC